MGRLLNEAIEAGAVEAESVFDGATHVVVYRRHGHIIPRNEVILSAWKIKPSKTW
ncbi:hypothetical protein KC19_VG197400 [Ceratodon purpureus]|uniref:Uncharacterized protein n=1 Tax=Ceratodon purpureus TaxID=3225 RepID=A0A8T0HRU9_CERPU|nr:hypothetical protein KC19_VG197400 [Ceratodon purpureus]